jgi:glycosyltransferase involved in cell wall biosynthesis
MTVSVCIPTYNSARYLRECLESVLAQSYTDFELVVSDDASTDNTREIVESYTDPRIRIHRLDQNMGLAFNLSRAAGLARGKYVKFLCHDDLLEPRCLENQVAMMERHAVLTMVTSGVRYVDSGGRTMKQVSRFSGEVTLRDVDIVAGNLLYGNVIGALSAVLIRRECLEKAGPFSAAFPESMDVEMWLRLAKQGLVGYLSEPLCRIRLHPETLTAKQRKMGLIRDDMRRITDAMLRLVPASFMVRRVAWGRVAGSFLKQALAGFADGHVKWPLEAIWQALRMDPALAGLMAYLVFFRTGLLRLAAGEKRKLGIRFGGTFHDRA